MYKDIGSFDGSRVFLGTFGKVVVDGEEMAAVSEVEAIVENDKQELDVMGSTWTHHKGGQKSGAGTITGFKLNSSAIKRGFDRFDMITSLDDPEAEGYETIRYKNCMADSIMLANAVAGEVVEEEIPFTFEGYELLDPID